MVNTHSKVIFTSVGAIAVASILPFSALGTYAAEEKNTNLQINLKEGLSVSITTPSEWASGDVDEFLRNKVSLNVVSNNSAGFTASMTTKTAETALTNTSKNTYTLPTLSSSTSRSSFPANYWGYSLDDTDAGNASSTYGALVGSGSTPITILSTTSGNSGSKDFYFGAKADVTKASGTYTGTVVISVVSGVVDDTTNPITPTNPAKPAATEQVATYSPAPTGSSSSGSTTYTYSRTNAGSGGASGSSSTNTTTTEVSEGNNVDSYAGYTPPQGVNEYTETNISTASPMGTAIAVAASAAAASGIFFFIVAKRRKEEEEEEEQNNQF